MLKITFWVYSSAKDSFRSAKNVVVFLFCILVGRPMVGLYAPSSGYATVFTPDVMSVHNVSRLLQFC